MTHSRPAKCVIPWCIFLALMFVSPAVCFAANHYVWCGAGGSGSGNDWSNAFTDLPVSLVRGDTYVVAGNSVCRYNFHLFNDAVSGTSVITVRKANAAQDSGVAGWQSSFETLPAQWCGTLGGAACWQFRTGYYVLDGITGSGTSGHGFVMVSNQTMSGFVKLGAGFTTPDICQNLTFKHLEINNTSAATVPPQSRGFVNSGCTVSNILFQYLYIHDIPGVPFLTDHWTNVTIDQSYVARNFSDASHHAEGISDFSSTNVIVSNNVWLDIVGTGTLISHQTATDWQIYGNVFAWDFLQQPGGGQGGGVIATDSAASAVFQNVKIYNNTFYNVTAGNGGIHFGSETNGGINSGDIQNNLFFNCRTDKFPSQTTHDYNTVLNPLLTFSGGNVHDVVVQSGAADPFVNKEGLNFQLLGESSPAGNALGVPYTLDLVGTNRGVDSGLWTRGALQFNPAIPVPPQNLKVTVF